MYALQHKPEKECIHSGHFMVSTFEAEEQDDEDNVAVPIPENTSDTVSVPLPLVSSESSRNEVISKDHPRNQQLSIDTSLSKLFRAMSLAYRQKLTSPKWNRFRGIRLRWKDKIRLNNVIWRCWHLQFIKKENTLICQFASPLDVDTHNKPEAVVLEGKYWKRKLAAVTAEYKRWRMFYRNNLLGHNRDCADQLLDLDLIGWESGSSENIDNIMMVDEDYMGLMSDTLFSTITNQPFVFPDSREIAKAGLADFIQPSLGPLQPNLEDYMDIDPFQALIANKLPTVPEEIQPSQNVTGWGYMDSPEDTMEMPPMQQVSQYRVPQAEILETRKPTITQQSYVQQQQYSSSSIASVQSYSSVISKNDMAASKGATSRSGLAYSKSSDDIYANYSQQSRSDQVINRVIITDASQTQRVPSQQQQGSQSMLPEYLEYKLVALPQQNRKQGYEFSVMTSPSAKFNGPVSQVQSQLQPYATLSQYDNLPRSSDDKPRSKGGSRGRGRSRSNTREPCKKPPLVSAASDPSLLNSQNSVLLTHLLANNKNHSGAIYTRSGSLDMIPTQVRIKDESNGNNSPILTQPSTTTIILPAPVTMSTVQSTSTEQLLLNSYSSSNSPISPIMDPLSQNINSPTSSQGSVGSPGGESSSYRDRRAVHIHAEQKRRCNIKNGFDMIHSLIPHLNQNPNAKLSKAAMLQKGAEYIRQLRDERGKLKAEMDSLRQQIDTLNSAISNCQSLLPATGAPVSRRNDSRMLEMYEEYVRMRTMENWKFWIFGLIFKSLLNSFNNFVSSSSLDDLYRSTLLWTEQYCSLVDLRPVVLNSLKYLCTTTDVLTKPERLPDETQQLAQKKGSLNNFNL